MIKEFTVEIKRVKNYQTFGLSICFIVPNNINNEIELEIYIKEQQEHVNKLVEEQITKVLK